MAGLVESMKKAAQEVMNDGKPCGVYFGMVDSVTPFRVVIDQKLPLTEEFLVVGERITEFSTDFTIAGEMWHGMRIGDELLCVRVQGGQKYIIMDFIKMADKDTRPAWSMTGEVVSDAPLAIEVNDYLTLTAEQLILCRNVTDFYVDMTVAHVTGLTSGGSGEAAFAVHNHAYAGRKKFLVHNGLKAGDTVLLNCERALQKWYVVDYISRVPGAVTGE